MLARGALILVSSSLALTFGSRRLPPPRTAEEDEADIEEHPWLLSLRKDLEHRCGASIIGAQWALTAARCVKDTQPGEITLLAGSAEYSTRGWTVGVDYIHMHPDYDETENDIALLHTQLEFPFGPKIKAIYLPEYELIIGQEGTAVGWGIANGTFPNYSPSFRVRTVVTVEEDYCNKQWLEDFSYHILCGQTMKEGFELCPGDEGGPLERGVYQFGVLSKVTCTMTPSISVFTNVPYYISWITSVQLNFTEIDDFR